MTPDGEDFIDPIFEDETSAPPARPGTPGPSVPDSDAQPVPRQPEARRPAPADDQPDNPAARQPTEDVQPRVAAAAVTARTPKPDDVVCTTCSLSNDRERTFCERCGSTLQHVPTPAPEAPLTWWQRFTRWLRGLGRGGVRGRTRSARRSTRVAYRRGLSIKNQVVRVVGLLGLVAGGLVAADVGPFGDARRAVFDRVSQEVVEIRPDSISVLPAEAELVNWPADEIADGRNNTAWGTAWDPDGAGASDCGATTGAAGRLRLTFPAARMERLELTLGLPDQNFENTARPATLGLRFSGSSECVVAPLEDTHDEQTIPLEVGSAQSVEIWVLDVVREDALDPDLALISELELFARE